MSTLKQLKKVVDVVLGENKMEDELTYDEMQTLKQINYDLAYYYSQAATSKTELDRKRLKQNIASCKSSISFFESAAKQRLAREMIQRCEDAIALAIKTAISLTP